MKEEINPVLSRENIYEEMIGLYQKRTTVLHRIEFKFEGEQAVGDGVSRDVPVVAVLLVLYFNFAIERICINLPLCIFFKNSTSDALEIHIRFK